jgi:hypothetical protein
MSRELMIEVMRKFGREFEIDTECTCATLLPAEALLSTGHKQGCPVDQAVRRYLAECGIV